jgi:hypothetical protein
MDNLKSKNEFYEWINDLKQTIKSARQTKLKYFYNNQNYYL